MKNVLIMIAFLIAFGIVGSFDAQDQQAERDHYCHMVARWHADAERGVPEFDRAGWPPFDGECE